MLFPGTCCCSMGALVTASSMSWFIMMVMASRRLVRACRSDLRRAFSSRKSCSEGGTWTFPVDDPFGVWEMAGASPKGAFDG